MTLGFVRLAPSHFAGEAAAIGKKTNIAAVIAVRRVTMELKPCPWIGLTGVSMSDDDCGDGSGAYTLYLEGHFRDGQKYTIAEFHDAATPVGKWLCEVLNREASDDAR